MVVHMRCIAGLAQLIMAHSLLLAANCPTLKAAQSRPRLVTCRGLNDLQDHFEEDTRIASGIWAKIISTTFWDRREELNSL